LEGHNHGLRATPFTGNQTGTDQDADAKAMTYVKILHEFSRDCTLIKLQFQQAG